MLNHLLHPQTALALAPPLALFLVLAPLELWLLRRSRRFPVGAPGAAPTCARFRCRLLLALALAALQAVALVLEMVNQVRISHHKGKSQSCCLFMTVYFDYFYTVQPIINCSIQPS